MDTIGASAAVTLSPEAMRRNTYPSFIPETSIHAAIARTGHKCASLSDSRCK